MIAYFARRGGERQLRRSNKSRTHRLNDSEEPPAPARQPGRRARDDEPDSPPDLSRALEFLRGRLDIRSLALTGLLTLAIMYTVYFARPVLMPVTLAFMMSFLLSPVMVFLERLGIPKSVGAAVVLVAILAAGGAGIYRLAGPASDWIERAPTSLAGIQDRFQVLTEQIEQVSRATQEVEEAVQVGEDDPAEVEIRERGILARLFSSGRAAAAGAGLILVLLYFLLASGDLFLRKLVRVLPKLSDKKRAVEIARSIREHVSTYLFTVSLINFGLGAVLAVAMVLLGMPNPILWGVMAALLNYVPYLGLLVGASIVGVVALLSFESLPHALLVPGTYLFVNGIEGGIVTPMLLGRNLTLNPVAIFIWVLLWGWMWGIVGAVVAVPMLVTVKIICDKIEPLNSVGEFLGR